MSVQVYEGSGPVEEPTQPRWIYRVSVRDIEQRMHNSQVVDDYEDAMAKAKELAIEFGVSHDRGDEIVDLLRTNVSRWELKHSQLAVPRGWGGEFNAVIDGNYDVIIQVYNEREP